MNDSGGGIVESLIQLPQDTPNSPAGTTGKIPQGRISILKGAGGSDDEGAAGPWVLGKEDADVSRYQIPPPRCQGEMLGGEAQLCLSLRAGRSVALWLRGRFCAILLLAAGSHSLKLLFSLLLETFNTHKAQPPFLVQLCRIQALCLMDLV